LEATVDFSKFKTSDWLKVGGGALMLIAYFLPWWSTDFGVGGDASVSGSEYFFTGTVPWLILIAVAVLTFLAVAGKFKLPPNIPAPLVFLGASLLALLLVLWRFFSDGVDSVAGFDIPTTRGAGLYLALVAAIAVFVGSLLGFKESGGDLNDLKDMNKLKGQFSHGGAGAPPPPSGYNPPPPPGGYTPPPPPPGAGSPPPPPPPPQ
jgi:hypothetical protein